MEPGFNITLERGRDGKLHLTKIEFQGLPGEECRDRMQEVIQKLRKRGVIVDVKDYISHQERQVQAVKVGGL